MCLSLLQLYSMLAIVLRNLMMGVSTTLRTCWRNYVSITAFSTGSGSFRRPGENAESESEFSRNKDAPALCVHILVCLGFNRES